MMISHKKKFIFIHNYKVAGTSIRKALGGNSSSSFGHSNLYDKFMYIIGLYPRVYPDQFQSHVQAHELKTLLPENIFGEYFKFGFVRNPWDWQVSLYSFMLKNENHFQHELVKSFKNFDEYIDWRVNDAIRFQKDFFFDGDVKLVDFIGKFENLSDDFNKVCAEIGIETELGHFNSSRKNNEGYLKFYSQGSIDIVGEAFRADIDEFGYQKPTLI